MLVKLRATSNFSFEFSQTPQFSSKCSWNSGSKVWLLILLLIVDRQRLSSAKTTKNILATSSQYSIKTKTKTVQSTYHLRWIRLDQWIWWSNTSATSKTHLCTLICLSTIWSNLWIKVWIWRIFLILKCSTTPSTTMNGQPPTLTLGRCWRRITSPSSNFDTNTLRFSNKSGRKMKLRLPRRLKERLT